MIIKNDVDFLLYLRKWISMNDVESINKVIKIKSNFDNFILSLAILENKLNIVSLMINHNVNINYKSSADGKTALISASDLGYIDIVKLLIENDADINIQDKAGNNALLVAYLNKKINVVEYLLPLMFNISGKNNFNANLLKLALKNKDSKTINLIIKHKTYHSKIIKFKKLNFNLNKSIYKL